MSHKGMNLRLSRRFKSDSEISGVFHWGTEGLRIPPGGLGGHFSEPHGAFRGFQGFSVEFFSASLRGVFRGPSGSYEGSKGIQGDYIGTHASSGGFTRSQRHFRRSLDVVGDYFLEFQVVSWGLKTRNVSRDLKGFHWDSKSIRGLSG